MKWMEYISPEHLMKQVLRDKINSVFLYCTKTQEREGFNFLFWTVPFDVWSWLLIGCSIIGITGILRGQYFAVFSILMRQECRILHGKRKLLIIFIMATIIFTYGYEGTISSFLTVQPEVVVYKTLKDLLDHNYVILSTKNARVHPYIPIFRRENITGTPHSRMVFVSQELRPKQIFSVLQQCNLTYAVKGEVKEAWKTAISTAIGQNTCHYVLKTVYSYDSVHQYLGNYYLKLLAVVERLIQSGVYEYFHDFEMYIENLPSMQRDEEMEFKAKFPIAFTMKDWKVISIFISWAALLFTALVAFVVEILWECK